MAMQFSSNSREILKNRLKTRLKTGRAIIRALHASNMRRRCGDLAVSYN